MHVHSWNDYVNGSKQPRWRDLIKSGLQAGTVFDGYRETLTLKKGYHAITRTYFQDGKPRPWNVVSFWGTFFSKTKATDPILLDVTEADNMAKRVFVEKVRQKQTTFQGGTFAAEAIKTVNLIRNPATSLRKRVGEYFHSLTKRGGILRTTPASRRRNVLADSWLEASFGWRPLLYDIDEGAQALAESGIIERDLRSPVRALGFSENTTHGAVAKIGNGYPGEYIQPLFREKVEVRYIGIVDSGSYSVFNPTRIGFDPSNWLPTIWEIIPWSFLIDYFVNVQDIVSAASLNTSGIRWIIRTERRISSYETLHISPTSTNATPGVQKDTTAVFSPSRVLHERRLVHREPYTGSLVPTVEFSLPGSTGQWLNIAALALSRNTVGRLLK
jgi:hypothetical protein